MRIRRFTAILVTIVFTLPRSVGAHDGMTSASAHESVAAAPGGHHIGHHASHGGDTGADACAVDSACGSGSAGDTQPSEDDRPGRAPADHNCDCLVSCGIVGPSTAAPARQSVAVVAVPPVVELIDHAATLPAPRPPYFQPFANAPPV